MMSLFKGDPAAALAKTQDRIASIERNIAELRATRQAKLVVAEDAAEVLQTDKAIEAEEVNLQIYRDKVRALKEEVRRGTYAQREKDRRTSIEKIKGALKTREKVAAELQATIERVGELYTRLIAPDEVEINWPFPRPGNKFAELDFRGVRREISWSLHGLVHQFRLPEPSSAGLGVVGITAQGIDGVVRQQNEAIVSRLETVGIADDLLDEAI
jgi:hypothetical protein